MIPADFITLAESMLQDPVEPARSRSIVSSAYYGAFHSAVSFLNEQALTVEANHGHLQHDYQMSGDFTGGEIGILLQELHALRVDADYRLQKQNAESRRTSVYSVSTARKIVQGLEHLRERFDRNASVKQTFVDAIVAYRQKVKRRV